MLAGEISALCKLLASGTVPIATLATLGTPVAASCLMLGGAMFLQWKARRRSAEQTQRLREHFGRIALAMDAVQADMAEGLAKLTEIYDRSRFVWARLDGADQAMIASRTKEAIRPLLIELGLSERVDLDSIWVQLDTIEQRQRVHFDITKGDSKKLDLLIRYAELQAGVVLAEDGDDLVQGLRSGAGGLPEEEAAFAERLEAEAASIRDTDGAENTRLFLIRELFLRRCELAEVDLAWLLSTVEDLRSTLLAGEVPHPIDAVVLGRLRVGVSWLALEFASIPHEVLFRAERHGMVMWIQALAILPELRDIDSVFPDWLADPEAGLRAKLYMGGGFAYELENIGRLVKTAISLSKLDRSSFTDGYAASGRVDPEVRGDYLFAYISEKTDSGEPDWEPSINALVGSGGEEPVDVGRFVARGVRLRGLTGAVDLAGEPRLYAFDDLHFYEWMRQQPTPSGRWHTEVTGQHNAPLAVMGTRTGGHYRVMLSEHAGIRVVDRDAARWVQPSGSVLGRLFSAGSTGKPIEIASSGLVPQRVKVRVPESPEPGFELLAEVKRRDRRPTIPVELIRVEAEEGPGSDQKPVQYRLVFESTKLVFSDWRASRCDDRLIFTLLGELEPGRQGWCVPVDVSGDVPHILGPVLQAPGSIMDVAYVRDDDVLTAYLTLMDCRRTPYRLQRWRLDEPGSVWRLDESWHPRDEAISEDGLDVHVLRTGEDTRVLYVTRKITGPPTVVALHALDVKSGETQTIRHLPDRYWSLSSVVIPLSDEG